MALRCPVWPPGVGCQCSGFCSPCCVLGSGIGVVPLLLLSLLLLPSRLLLLLLLMLVEPGLAGDAGIGDRFGGLAETRANPFLLLVLLATDLASDVESSLGWRRLVVVFLLVRGLASGVCNCYALLFLACCLSWFRSPSLVGNAASQAWHVHRHAGAGFVGSGIAALHLCLDRRVPRSWLHPRHTLAVSSILMSWISCRWRSSDRCIVVHMLE